MDKTGGSGILSTGAAPGFAPLRGQAVRLVT
jgi:hypothetical protein